MEINVRDTTKTVGGANTVNHEANTIERFIGGAGDDILNLHRPEGGLLELGDGFLRWDGTPISHSEIERIDIRFVDGDGVRTGAVRVLEDQDYTGSELRIEARGIEIRASIKADGLSLQATNIVGIRQDFGVETGLGKLIVLEADRMRISADNGVGDLDMPLYIRANTLEAQSLGAAGIYIVTLGDTTIGNVSFGSIGATTSGLKTQSGGNIHIINLGGTIKVEEATRARGGNIVITTERIDIDAEISSIRTIGTQTFRGTLVLQPLSTRSSIGMATEGAQAGQTLHLSGDEIKLFMKGFDSAEPATYYANRRLVTSQAVSGINIGRTDGRHVIVLGAFTYSESVTFRAPQIPGRFDIIGTISLTASTVDGQSPSLTFLGEP